MVAEVDFEKTVALVVELEAGAQEAIIGGGRYVEYGGEEDTVRPAEIAFMVKDEFQGQGMAKLFMKHLTLIARARGITLFKPRIVTPEVCGPPDFPTAVTAHTPDGR